MSVEFRDWLAVSWVDLSSICVSMVFSDSTLECELFSPWALDLEVPILTHFFLVFWASVQNTGVASKVDWTHTEAKLDYSSFEDDTSTLVWVKRLHLRLHLWHLLQRLLRTMLLYVMKSYFLFRRRIDRSTTHLFRCKMRSWFPDCCFSGTICEVTLSWPGPGVRDVSYLLLGILSESLTSLLISSRSFFSNSSSSFNIFNLLLCVVRSSQLDKERLMRQFSRF